MCGRSALTIAWALMPAFCSCFGRTACLLVPTCLRPLALSFCLAIDNTPQLRKRWDPSTHVRVATTPELLGLCEKARRRATSLQSTWSASRPRDARDALVRRLLRRTSRSPLSSVPARARAAALPCPTPPATTSVPLSQLKLQASRSQR